MISEVRIPSTGELSTPQLPRAGIAPLNSPVLQKPGGLSYSEINSLRKDPTISLCRELIPGPILAANWGFDENEDWVNANGEVPPEAKALIKRDMLKVRDALLTISIKGLVDYGWVPFEKIFEVLDDGYIHLTKVKGLVQAHTNILVDPANGAFAGFYQAPDTTVPLEKSLAFTSDVEGTNWYGTSSFDAARKPINDWDTANEGANRYDEKIAGSHWLVRYPIGRTEYKGVEMDNYDIAVDVLNSLESSGKIILPNSLTKFVQKMNEEEKGWNVTVISDATARQYSFTNRLEYLDKLKVRAMGYPERAILEGNMGTKAEAGVHANIAASAQDVRHRYICSVLNESVVDQLLTINFGPEFAGALRIIPAPITDASISFLQNVYKMMMNSPEAVVAEYNGGTDMNRFKDKIGIPHSEGEVTIQLPESGTQNRFNTNPS